MTRRTSPNSYRQFPATAIQRNPKIAIPISESDAQIIDEARRALIARSTETPMLQPTPDLQMTTRQIDMPEGVHEVEIHHITVTFSDDAPVRRARVSTMLQSHFGRRIKPENAGQDVWRYTVNSSSRLDFSTLNDIHDAIAAIASDKVELSRIQGLFIQGIFVSEKDSSGVTAFTLSGDHTSDNPWHAAA